MIQYTTDGYLNFNGSGRPIAVINSNRKREKNIFLSNNEIKDASHLWDLNKIGLTKSHFQLIPDDSGRQCVYVCGQSGSGKSFLHSQIFRRIP